MPKPELQRDPFAAWANAGRRGENPQRLKPVVSSVDYLDQALDKAMFEARKQSLLIDQKATETNLANLARNGSATPTRLEKFLEQAGRAELSHTIALPEERRDMVNIFTSNRFVDGKNVDFKPSLPFQEIVNRPELTYCDPQQDIPRTWDKIIDHLSALNSQELLPDLSFLMDVGKTPKPDNPIEDIRDDSNGSGEMGVGG